MKTNALSRLFEQFSSVVTRFTGSSTAFLLACFVILGWIITGPIFNYSNTWQLVINTGTTIVTFLMVFLIQKAQNKDSLAIQIKLDELISATDAASNRLLNVEDLSEDELRMLRQYFSRLADLADADDRFHQTRTPQEAAERHQEKIASRKSKVKSR
jgi:low affinity Fe/Cu permease